MDTSMPQLVQAQNDSVKNKSIFQCVIWILIAGFVPQCAWALTSRGFEDQCFVTITCDQKHGPEDEVSSSPLIKLQ